MTATVQLKAAGERSMARRHPWLFSGALAKIKGAPGAGETVALLDQKGRTLGWGAYSPASQIAVRVWSFSEDAVIDQDFFAQRLASAVEMRRQQLPQIFAQGCRLIHGESDGFPGLIIDRYGDFAVLQCLSAGAERWKSLWASWLMEHLAIRGVFERSDASVRRKEGLELHKGSVCGDAPPEMIEIEEGGMRLLVDVREGHKTGAYLDQRANRQALRRIAQDKEVLNCFAYTGGFGLAALAGGARHVTQIEASSRALETAQQHLEDNQLPLERSTLIEGDVFVKLRTFRDAARQFDVIVLDPPKFAESKHQVEKASRGYKDINLLALKLLRPGGLLLTFSCSGQITAPLFQKIVAGAALDAKRDTQILRSLTQDVDHPTLLSFPEGAYLKGLLCRAA